ncbi:hypothetical protein CGRA01v4_13576 [Colletotrichum graminicola]|nr:hypothetical protein CGRA01v4_13576 [Colletotrichum graminicola]
MHATVYGPNGHRRLRPRSVLPTRCLGIWSYSWTKRR